MSLRDDAKELYQEKKYRTALETFLAEDIDPVGDMELAYYLGLCYTRIEAYPEAIAHLEIITKHQTNFAWSYQAQMLLAWLFIEVDSIDKAAEQLQAVLKEGYESAQVWSVLGYCCWRQGRDKEARECYRSALNVDGENANASNGLGFLLAEKRINLEESVRLCRKALERDPENAAYKDSLGWALFQAGNPEEGIRYLVEAKSRRPHDGTIQQHLEALRTYEINQ